MPQATQTQHAGAVRPKRATQRRAVGARPKRVAQPIEVLKVREALLMKPTVSLVTGMSSSSIARKVASGDFPSPVKDGPRCTRWVCGAVLDWLAARAETTAATCQVGA